MTTVELHGIKRQPFPNFAEDGTYLERVTLPDHDEAVEVLRQEGCDWGRDGPELKPIWMRYIDGEEAEGMIEREEVYAEGPEFWWECDEADPGAVPFWWDGE